MWFVLAHCHSGYHRKHLNNFHLSHHKMNPHPLLPEKKIRRFLLQSNLLPLQMHHHLPLPLPHHQTLLLPLGEALRYNHYSFPQLFLRPSLQGVTRPFHHVQNPIRDIQDQTNRPRTPPPPKRYKQNLISDIRQHSNNCFFPWPQDNNIRFPKEKTYQSGAHFRFTSAQV